MAQPSVYPDNGKWKLFKKYIPEMKTGGKLPQLLKPTISVQCANLYPDAHYRLAIDFAMISKKGRFDKPENQWFFENTVVPNFETNSDNLKYHESDRQTGKYFMNNVTRFDTIRLVKTPWKDEGVRQYVCLEQKHKYVPVIKLYRSDTSMERWRLEGNFPLYEACFVVVGMVYSCSKMKKLKAKAEGRKVMGRERTRNSTCSSSSLSCSSGASTPTVPSQVASTSSVADNHSVSLPLDPELLAFIANSHPDYAVVSNNDIPSQTLYSAYSQVQEWMNGLYMWSLVLSNLVPLKTAQQPQPTCPAFQSFLAHMSNLNHILLTFIASYAPQKLYNQLIQSVPPSSAAAATALTLQLQRALAPNTVINEQNVAQPFPVTFQQQHASITNSANMFPNQMNAQNMVNSLPQPQNPMNAALRNSFDLQPMPAPSNSTANFAALVPQPDVSTVFNMVANGWNNLLQQVNVNHNPQYAPAQGHNQ